MLHIGKTNTLEVVKAVDFGYYLDGGPFGEILLPGNAAPEDLEPGTDIDVFIYTDTEDRLIATTLEPKIKVGEFAFLEVRQNGPNGAYMDWGLSGKDLLVPFREQATDMFEGESYIIYAYLDKKTDRIAGSGRLANRLKEETEGLTTGDEVDLIAVTTTDLGWKMIVNQQYWGMVFFSDIFQDIQRGDYLKGFVKQVREDQKVDISLQKLGYEQVTDTADWLLKVLREQEGFLPLTDKSKPEAIYQKLQVSKKVFKKAVGSLYKRRLIQLEKEGIRLAEIME